MVKEERRWENLAHLSSELRARFDELGGVGHEPSILRFISSDPPHTQP